MSWLENNNRHMSRKKAIEFGILKENSTKTCVLHSDEYVYIHDIETRVTKDLTNIQDSMLLDSGTTIAVLIDKTAGRIVSIEVNGYVAVDWCPDGDFNFGNIETYTCPSDFPKKLKDIIATNPEWTKDPRVSVNENNWFEIFVNEENEKGYFTTIHYDVVDVKNNTPEQLIALLEQTYKEIFEKEYNKEINETEMERE